MRASALPITLTLAGAALLASAAPAAADDDAAPEPDGAGVDAPKKKTQFGVAVRLRNVRMPEGFTELFVDDAPSGLSEFGLGLEFARRRGNFELQLGLEYEKLQFARGLWIEKGKPIPENEPDFVEFESQGGGNFGWFSIEVSFINHTEMAKNFFLRYGGGAGLAIFRNDVIRTDYRCSSNSKDSCTAIPNAPNNRDPYDLPPVFPIINAIFGVQYRAGDNLAFNLEGGLRTLPFVGGSIGYYF